MESWEHSSGCCPSFTFLADVVHASELFVSGVGMGALERVRSSGAPLLVLLGDQPEQARNVAELVLRSPGFALREVLVGDPGAWVEAFVELVRAARVVSRGRRALVAHPRPAF